jgi:hypothetical protein
VSSCELSRVIRAKRFSERTRTAYHEAGHAVLSAALDDTPAYVSIRSDRHTLGRNGMKMTARATSLVQVALAGYAAEHLLTGRRSRQCRREVALGILTHVDPELGASMRSVLGCDGHRAVQYLLTMVGADTEDELEIEVDRFYEIARESLSGVWPVIVAVARALLRHGELGRAALDEALGGFDIYSPVFAVQRQYGLIRLPATASSRAT